MQRYFERRAFMFHFNARQRHVASSLFFLITLFGNLALFSSNSAHAQDGQLTVGDNPEASAAAVLLLQTDEKIAAAREKSANVDRASDPQEWAKIQYALAMVLVDRALMSEKTSTRLEFFSEAMAKLKAAQEEYSVESDPQNWAQCQYDQAVVHSYIIPLLDSEQANNRFKESIAAYQDLLEQVSPEDAREVYDRALYNLAATLWNGRRRVPQEEVPSLLEKALQFAERSLEKRRREEVPMLWARSQTLIAFIHRDRADLAGKEEQPVSLKESIAASQSALEILTDDVHRQEWINVQSNLAQCLTTLASISVNDQAGPIIDQAIAETRQLLKVVNPASQLELWSNMQYNLSTNLYLQASRYGGVERLRLLNQSIAAMQIMYQVNPGARKGTLIGLMRRDLGDTLLNLAASTNSRDESRSLLLEAVDAYRDAANLYRLTQDRAELVSIYQRLGTSLSELAAVTEDAAKIERLRSASADAWRESIAIAELIPLPEQVALSQVSLGRIQFFQGLSGPFAVNAHLLDQAMANLRAGIDALPIQTYALQRAMGQEFLGHASMAKAERVTDASEIELLQASLEAFNRVLEAQPERTQVVTTVVDLLVRLGDRYLNAAQGQDASDSLSGRVEIEKAINAYREALSQTDRETAPALWGRIQAKLLTLELKVAEADEDQKDVESFRRKVAEFQEVIQLLSAQDSPQLWMQTQLNLGLLLHQQARLASGSERTNLLEQAIQHNQLGIERLRELDPQEAESHSRWLDQIKAELADEKEPQPSGER
jgi:tetratricopeptide (TPR) repeat protein